MSTRIAITGSGVDAPRDVVSNDELCASFNAWVRSENERRADAIRDGIEAPLEESSPEFVERVSGIRRRHFWTRAGVLDPRFMCPQIPERPPEELSVQAEFALGAARRALASASRDGSEVDLVIVGASSLQRPYPAVAIELQNAIGARGMAYDLSVGCASAGFGIQLANEAIRSGSARCALVCAPELPSAYSNFRDRDSHFILGDAAAAVVLEPLDRAREGGFEILSSFCSTRFSSNVRNDGGFLNRCDLAHRDDRNKLFHQNGRRVFKDIVQLVPALLSEHLGERGVSTSDVARYWLHQANAQMAASILRRLLGREAEPSEAPSVLGEYGNTAAAGALIAFDHHRGDMQDGALGVLCAFGAGYTVSGQLLRRFS
jgi:beta-ketodecanoyl-[acyl-carrier-protein] synthase